MVKAFKKLFGSIEKKAREKDLKKFMNHPFMKKAAEVLVESELLVLLIKGLEIPPTFVIPIVDGKIKLFNSPYTYVAYITTTGECPYEFKFKLTKITLPRRSLIFDVYIVQLTDDEVEELKKQEGVKVL